MKCDMIAGYADFMVLLAGDVYEEVKNPKPYSNVPSSVWIAFFVIASTIATLNYWWFSKMLNVLANIYKGSSWTSASETSVLKDD